MKIILWILLLIVCWPAALIVAVLYPVIWLVLLPFRLLGLAIDLSFDIIKTIIMFPFRIIGYKG